MDKIHNPITNKWVNISGKTGKTVLTNYIKTLNMSGGAKKKKAKFTPAPAAVAPAAAAAAAAVAAEVEARVARRAALNRMLDLPPRWLGGGAARNAAEAKNLLLDAAWKAAVAEVGKTRKAAKAEAAARSNFVA